MKLIDTIYQLLKPKELNEDLQMFEIKMQYILKPVKPNARYVYSLRRNLNQRYKELELQLKQPKHTVLQTGLLIFGGIIGSLFVVLTGLRGVISVIGMVGLIINRYKRYSRENLTPTSIIQGS
ncbi:MAG: hypothetical protein ACK2U1_19625 [Anaerolineales bacterium]|jgi:hypothetical protein